MSEQQEITVEDAKSVLSGEPTITERLDKLEKMMQEILNRLPQTYYNYTTSAGTSYTSTSSAPYIVYTK